MSKKMEDINIGLRIKEIRSELKWNQKRFANKIGATVSALSNWENGRNKPNTVMLSKIAGLGGITVEELLYGDLKIIINKKISEAIDSSKYKYNEDELNKINNNRDKIIDINRSLFEFIVLSEDEENTLDIINSSLRSFLFDSRDINEKLLSETSYHIDKLKFDIMGMGISGFKDDKNKLIPSYFRGVYEYDTIEVFHDGLNEIIYNEIRTILSESYKNIDSLYKLHYPERFIDNKWLKKRNLVLSSFSEEQFRKYSYYVHEMISRDEIGDGIDSILKTIIPDLDNVKYNIEYDELKNTLESFLNNLYIPDDWKVPIKSISR